MDFESCEFRMAYDIIITINRTKDGYFHGIMSRKKVNIWMEHIEEEEMDGLVFAAYKKHWIDSDGHIRENVKCKAKFKFE